MPTRDEREADDRCDGSVSPKSTANVTPIRLSVDSSKAAGDRGNVFDANILEAERAARSEHHKIHHTCEHRRVGERG